MTSVQNTICVGAIIGAHGIKGSVRVRSFTQDPEDLFTYAPLQDLKGTKTFSLIPLGVMKDHFIAQIDGISDRTQAEELKGTKLYVDRANMPATQEREYYAADLIGLEVRIEGQETKCGIVVDLHDYGAGAFLEIKPLTGATFMLPFKDAFVPVINWEQKFLTAVIPDGWMKDETPVEKPVFKKKSGKHKMSQTDKSNKQEELA